MLKKVPMKKTHGLYLLTLGVIAIISYFAISVFGHMSLFNRMMMPVGIKISLDSLFFIAIGLGIGGIYIFIKSDN